jgi:hypothetical protein
LFEQLGKFFSRSYIKTTSLTKPLIHERGFELLDSLDPPCHQVVLIARDLAGFVLLLDAAALGDPTIAAVGATSIQRRTSAQIVRCVKVKSRRTPQRPALW